MSSTTDNLNNPQGGRFDALKEKANRYIQHVLALPNDSFEKTVAVAFGLCLAGAILVSGSAVALKSLQESNKAKDEKVNILEVAGLLTDKGKVDEAFKQFEPKIVDLASGQYVDNIDPASFDQRKAAKDPAMSIAIPADQDIANIKRRPKYAKVYLVKEGGKTKTIVLPVSGYGLWSTMYGYLALEGDGETVIGLNLFDQAETPGLGGEVVNPKWKALWKGKKVYNLSSKQVLESNLSEKGQSIEIGEVALGLVKGSVDPSKPGSEYQVDALAGATLTSRGVSNLIRYWMGKDGFGRYLVTFRSGRG
ncbi:MAG: Na(+)-translocating NADH-quinone reductase subunit C [Methylotetracoccus sp.]